MRLGDTIAVPPPTRIRASTRQHRLPAIVAEGVEHSYGSGDTANQVLYKNELTLYRGEIVIMTGPSGSGKTTLLTLIGGLRSLQKGELSVLGHAMGGMSKSELVAHRQRIGFIFQGHNLFPALSALQNVRLALDREAIAGREKTRRAAEILERLGLSARMHAKPQQLSGGQKQRVAIARALVHHPRVILADEPTAALDGESGAEVVALLQERAREDQCTVLLVTHDPRVLDVADRIVSMVDGRIVGDVDVEESVTICGFLRRCELFRAHDAAGLERIAGQLKFERFQPGQAIVQEGEAGDRFFLIREGAVRVSKAQPDGSEQLLATLEAGDVFGEAALLREEPRNATVRAVGEASAYTLAKHAFDRAVATSTSLRDQLVALNLRRASQRGGSDGQR